MVESGVGGRERMGRGVPANSVLVSCIQGSDPLVLVGSQVDKAANRDSLLISSAESLLMSAFRLVISLFAIVSRESSSSFMVLNQR